ncbi:LamG domain-containing protein [Streptomyces sp. L2]|uniref:LamG domain-containing protein n=1 Tax=Streptomyces sp. L2 TaxID=2162665 RepID=UPI00101092FA|nr:LamG domain-containing protein [Streptomyces sp. L2]
MFAAVLSLPAQQASAALGESDPAPLSEGQQALADARQSGHQVEVMSQRTDRTTVFANPDGYSFTLQESAVPVRVGTAGGGWQAPDATLVRRSDGSVAPKAAAVGMTFSGGGDRTPLARITDRGRSMELSWPGSLPAPTLDGTSALYPDVLPGVDLQLNATPESFQPVFVVKTAEAAANDQLKKLTFGLKADGLQVREGPSGNLVAVDASGQTVFKAPPARMWDSAGQATGTQTKLMRTEAVGTNGSGPSGTSATGAALADEGVEPGQGDTVARMDVEVGKNSLTVVPDARMLDSTDASAFPVFIDPTVTWGESERTLLRSDGYESYGWGNGDDDQGKGAGKCGSWSGYYCGPGYVQKLYFEFSPSSLKGKKVLDATFRVTEPWAFQCDPRWVDLVRTNNISSSTTWSSRPKELDWMVDRYVSAGRGSLCDPDSPKAPIEFNDSAKEPNENLTPTVADFAAGKFSRLTLELRAHDESDTSAWKRFRNDAVLAVTFVGLPDKATGVGLNVNKKPVCEHHESDPQIVDTVRPQLMATTQTKPGGEKDAQLRMYFDVDVKSGTTWADAAESGGDTSPSTGYVGDGSNRTLTWSALTEGKLYRYRAWVLSYYNGAKSYLEGPSSETVNGWCYFKIDASAPKAPQVTFGAPYTECTTNACAPHGGPGVAGTFTFKAAAGDGNVVAYKYKLTDGAAWSTLKGSTVNVVITPQVAGTHRLYVLAVDDVGLGRPGTQSVVDFLVAAGQGPVGRWHFGESSGVAVDSATAGDRHDATLGGGAVRDDRGRRGLITHDSQGLPLGTPVTDRGLSLNGTTGYAQTGAPVLETRSAFTLSAWVRLEKKAGYATVLSQRGPDGDPFAFWYSGALKNWYFGIRKADGSGYWGTPAVFPAQTGVWTFLAGSYDPATKQLKFYVDGRLQYKAVTTEGSWPSTEPLQFGRTQTGTSSYTNYFPGSIDEVAVWQRVLTPEEIAREAQLFSSDSFAGVELVADWSPDQGSGTTVPDTTSGYGKNLTLTGGSTLDDGAMLFDGNDGTASTSGPLVSEHASFTVTTLVQLDSAKLLSKDVGYIGQVLGQRTADGSSWGLWYKLTGKESFLDDVTGEERTVPIGKWQFGRLNDDGTLSAVASAGTAVLDSPVRLTGIYNSLNGKISLYLGHHQDGDAQAFTVKLGSGDFAVGKGFTNGAWQHYVPARVWDVRLWAGAMAGIDQVEETVGD